jgi:hypothetical protein
MDLTTGIYGMKEVIKLKYQFMKKKRIILIFTTNTII